MYWPLLPSKCPQPQFLDQPILQRAVRPLHTALGLRAVGTENIDAQLRQGAAELGRAVAARSVLGIHPKDAVLVAVERDRLAMPLKIAARRAEIVEVPLPTRQTADASIGLSRRQQTPAACTSLRGPQTRRVPIRRSAPARPSNRAGGAADAGRAADGGRSTHRPAAIIQTRNVSREIVQPCIPARVFRRQRRTKISVSFANQRQRQLTICFGQTICCSADRAVSKPGWRRPRASNRPATERPAAASGRAVRRRLRHADGQTERPAALRADRIPSCSSTPPSSRTPKAPRTSGSVTSTLALPHEACWARREGRA